LLAVFAAAIYGPYAVDGGFLSDAWSIQALYEFAPKEGFFGAAEHMLDQPNLRQRPLNAVYLAALVEVFGSHMGFWIAWAGAVGVLMSVCLFVLLRELGVTRVHAGAMATLVLIFPASSALKLWTAVPGNQLAISLTIVGLLLALRAFKAGGRRGLALHGGSLAMFVASLLLYEAALPIMLASLLLYRLQVSWRAAARRWAADCVALVPLALGITRSSNFETQDAEGMWQHMEIIWDQAQTLLTTVVLPFGTDRWYALVPIGLVVVAALVVQHLLPPGDLARIALRRWLSVVAAGLVVVVLGYAIFVPAIDYYSPLSAGIGNRVNAVPGIGWVLVAYGVVMVASTLVFRGVPNERLLTAGMAGAACLVIGVNWVQAVDRDANAYERAFAAGQRVLQTMGAALPEPPPRSTIWTFGQPVEEVPGVPIFGNTWDMTDSVKLHYGDPTLASLVGFPGTTFDCRADRIVPGGSPHYQIEGRYLTGFDSRYGRTYFLETTSGRLERIVTPAQCRRASESFPRSPGLPLGP
jgi:hypothetical protein